MRAKLASEFPFFRRNMNTITFLSKLFEMYVTLGRVMGVGGVRVWGVCGSCVVGGGTGACWGVCGAFVGCVWGRGGCWGAVVEREYRSPLYYPDTLVNPDTCLGNIV